MKSLLALILLISFSQSTLAEEYSFPKDIGAWEATMTFSTLQPFHDMKWNDNFGIPKYGKSRLNPRLSRKLYREFSEIDNHRGKGHRKLVVGYARPVSGVTDKLVVLLPGTGGVYNDDATKYYASLLVSRGYTVLTMNSTLHWQFVLGASSSGVVGDMKKDAEDLYHGIRSVLNYYGFQYSELHLMGYSLGAMQAAYVGQIDTQVNDSVFDKVVLINPPVNLAYSVNVIEGLESSLTSHVPDLVKTIMGCAGQFKATMKGRGQEYYFNDLIGRIRSGWCGSVESIQALINYAMTAFIDKSAQASLYIRSSKDGGSISKRQLEGIKDWNFHDYLRVVGGHKNPDQFLQQFDLRNLKSYLSKKNVYLLHNADDFIIDGKEQLKFLESSFAERGVIYPRGGHLGNVWLNQNEDDLIGILEK